MRSRRRKGNSLTLYKAVSQEGAPSPKATLPCSKLGFPMIIALTRSYRSYKAIVPFQKEWPYKSGATVYVGGGWRACVSACVLAIVHATVRV